MSPGNQQDLIDQRHCELYDPVALQPTCPPDAIQTWLVFMCVNTITTVGYETFKLADVACKSNFSCHLEAKTVDRPD
jgi:hypothetical protein